MVVVAVILVGVAVVVVVVVIGAAVVFLTGPAIFISVSVVPI